MIEFGDFEVKLLQRMNKHDECVELPTSWPEDSPQLSFCLPSQIIEAGSNDHSVSDSSPLKCTNISAQNTETVLCNGTSDGGHVTKDTEPIVNGVQTDCNKEHSSNPSKSNENTLVADSTKDHSLQITIGNKTAISNQVPLQNDKLTYSEINNNRKLSSNVNTNGVTNLNPELSDKSLDSINTDSVSDERTNTENTKIVESSSENKTCVKTDPTNQSKPVTSWAGLFRGTTVTNGSNDSSQPSSKTKLASQRKSSSSQEIKATTEPSNTKSGTNSVKPMRNGSAATKPTLCIVKPSEDPNAKELAEELSSMELIYKPQAFIPRGLTNVSNWCYINATLQALLVCPPFYQLLKSISSQTPLSKKTVTCSPIIDSFLQLASEFRPLSTKRGFVTKDVRHGPPFEPRHMYDMLGLIKSPLSEKGRQEDAEEFQSCVLNGLHDEMTQLISYFNDSAAPDAQSNGNNIEQDDSSSASEELGNEDQSVDEWEEVITTKKNKSAVTRRAGSSKTPVSEMFRGELCTAVYRPGQKVSVTYEPFFSLPLSVPPEHTWSVEDALLSLTDKETFVTDGQTKSDAFRQQTLETLPPVFILHLKRFVYDKSGGLRKIDKKVEYKTDLVIGKDLLSKSSKKLSTAHRTYKLFAVVYHHGEKATGGHYTTDVFHIGLSSWLRIDDHNIRTVHHTDVTRHNPSRTAYLLYYRRTDLG